MNDFNLRPRRFDDGGAVVFLVAPIWTFSERLASTIESDLDIGVMRLERLDALPAALDRTSRAARLVLIDATLVLDAGGAPADLRALSDRLPVAFCYRGTAEVERLNALLAPAGCLGTVGFVPVNVSIDAVLAILQALLAGVPVFPSECLAHTAAAGPAPFLPDAGTDIPLLTRRETEVLALAARSLGNKAIANELGISIHTVKLHMQNAMRKTGTMNRVGAVSWYRDHVQTTG